MNFIVNTQIKLETSKGVINLSPGQIIELDPENATRLIEEGIINPIENKISLQGEKYQEMPLDDFEKKTQS